MTIPTIGGIICELVSTYLITSGSYKNYKNIIEVPANNKEDLRIIMCISIGIILGIISVYLNGYIAGFSLVFLLGISMFLVIKIKRTQQ